MKQANYGRGLDVALSQTAILRCLQDTAQLQS